MKVTISVECETPTEAEVILSRLTKGTKGTWLDLLSDKEDRFQSIIDAKSPDVKSTKRVEDPTEQVLEDVPIDRIDKSPGKTTITKIGGNSKQEILEKLNNGEQPHPKYTEHLKLLWSRHEIKFDGTEYYL